jgi:hypothetical protein
MSPQLVLVDVEEQVWRIGFKPEPWGWSGWEWAGTDGRFGGRWDDSQGNFRTVYAGSTLLACLLEVLAGFRPEPTLVLDLDGIEEDEEDAEHYPTSRPGELPYSGLEPRLAASATLTGTFCAVTAAESIAALHPRFVAMARMLSLHDFDAAALKNGKPRELTQSIATHLHAATDVTGVTFESRHGDDLVLWAVFERADDPSVSPALTALEHHQLTPEHPDLLEAFRLLGLTWEGRSDDNHPEETATPEADMPLAIVETDGREVWSEKTVDGELSPTTAWGAACLFWQALDDPVENRPALELLSYNPADWGDYIEVADMIASRSITGAVHDNPDRDDIRYVKFIEFSGSGAAVAFAPVPLDDVMVLTLVQPDGDAWWRVWGICQNRFPETAEIMGSSDASR